ncbi:MULTISPECIES: YqgE/AlgH family protein [unclassified Ekhidna]|jgi:putative transcriptional regulator|uniref:YqgE/AlgH family protein n=1 Tax=unclassified Ekhidna TaxID=2632188 RepID=UPI0032DFDFA2
MDFFSSDKIVEPQKGDLLISEPYLPDPNFERTVIFLCEHDENGTFGFVLNKAANIALSELIDEVGNYPGKVFMGGPVEKDTLHFIHREPALIESSREVVKGVYWGGDFNKLIEMTNTRAIQTEDVRFFIGYSGWAAGQLMDEMRAKSWIVLKNTTPEMIFDWDNQDLWKACLQTMGGKFRLISNYPKDPRLN